jgi:hypothetical protein
MSATTVHLAYPGEWMPNVCAAAPSQQTHPRAATAAEDAWTDKAGGRPLWPTPEELGVTEDALRTPMQEQQSQQEFPVCARCQSNMLLLVQVHLPASASAPARSAAATARIVYVFACNRAECSGSAGEENKSFKVVRLAYDEQAATAAEQDGSGAADVQPSSTVPGAVPAAASSGAQAASATAATVAASATAPAAAAPKPLFDEFASWSSDEDAKAAKQKKKSKAKKVSKKAASAEAADEEDDDDAVLSSLLAQQTQLQSAAKAEKDKKAEQAAAKAAAKAEQQRQAQEELLEKVLAARAAAGGAKGQVAAESVSAAATAAASSSTSAASSQTAAAASPAPAPRYCFRPFYLTWCTEPSSSAASNAGDAARLLREFEERVAREGDDDERAELGALAAVGVGSGSLAAASSAASAGREDSRLSSSAAGTGGDDDDSDDDDDAAPRIDEAEQAFMDRLARLPEQCLRYYEVPTAAAAAAAGGWKRHGAVFSHKHEVDFRDALAKLAAAAPASSLGNATAAASSTAASAASSQHKQSGASSAAAAASAFPLRCPSCGRARELELQLLPPLLAELHPGDDGVDFAALDVYTCPAACVRNQFVEEAVHAQPGR